MKKTVNELKVPFSETNLTKWTKVVITKVSLEFLKKRTYEIYKVLSF